MNRHWKDHGLILDLNLLLASYQLDLKWAQGPQILDLGNRFRMYFSTRRLDLNGLPVSTVYFVDLNQNFTEFLNLPAPIKIDSGVLGSFDEHGIFPFHVYKISPDIFVALTTGWRRLSNVSIDMAIGQAISLDGKHFARNGNGPLIGPINQEPFLIGDPFVLKTETNFKLFYIFGTKWDVFNGVPEREYKIGSMTSLNGLDFSRNNPGKQIIPDTIENEAQAMPTVVKIGKKLHMFYSFRNIIDFRHNFENSYRLGHASSIDGENWLVDHTILPDIYPAWASEMQCYPNAIIKNNILYIFYNGNSFGKFGIGLMSLDIRWLM